MWTIRFLHGFNIQHRRRQTFRVAALIKFFFCRNMIAQRKNVWQNTLADSWHNLSFINTLTSSFKRDFCLHFVRFTVRLCFVEARGTYRKENKFCPILAQKSDIECVVGLDRSDCLRRIHKGTAHFGVFSSEDLIAAEWANIDVLITSEVRFNESVYLYYVFHFYLAVNRFISFVCWNVGFFRRSVWIWSRCYCGKWCGNQFDEWFTRQSFLSSWPWSHKSLDRYFSECKHVGCVDCTRRNIIPTFNTINKCVCFLFPSFFFFFYIDITQSSILNRRW